MRDELFASGPEVHDRSPSDELCADAIPFPLDEPAARITQRLDRILERRGKKERVGTRSIVVCSLVREQRRIPVGRRRPFAHDTCRDGCRRQLCRLTQCADDQGLRDADAQLAGDELEEDVALQSVERSPPRGHARLLRRRVQALEWQDAIFDPLRQRQVLGRRGWQLIEDERGRFGAVADDGVTLVEDPRRKTGGRERPGVNGGVGQKPLQPPAGEKEHCPRRVRGGRRLKVLRHRVDFGVGRRRSVDRVVEASEALHQSPSGSPSQAVRMVPASRPISRR